MGGHLSACIDRDMTGPVLGLGCTVLVREGSKEEVGVAVLETEVTLDDWTLDCGDSADWTVLTVVAEVFTGDALPAII